MEGYILGQKVINKRLLDNETKQGHLIQYTRSKVVP